MTFAGPESLAEWGTPRLAGTPGGSKSSSITGGNGTRSTTRNRECLSQLALRLFLARRHPDVKLGSTAKYSVFVLDSQYPERAMQRGIRAGEGHARQPAA